VSRSSIILSSARSISVLLTLLLLAACQAVPAGSTTAAVTPAAQTGPASGGTLRYGLTLPVSGIDPHVNASSELGIALSGVYDTLVVQDKDGKFHPSLAQSWTVSDDGKTYTLKLRQDVKFHDGTSFNAAAVVRNLQRVTDPATKSQKAVFLLGPFDHTEAVDEYTVKIVLKSPYAPLLDGLSQVYLGMASPAALDKWGVDDYQLHQVGTGPFKFVSYQERQSLVIVRNADYEWASEIRGHQGPAYLDRVEFTFYADPATRLPALLSGQAQVMGELPPKDADQLKNGANAAQYAVYPVAIPGQSVQFFLNTQLAPLDDARVRRALLYATDRAALVKAVYGGYSPVATGPLSAVTRWALGAVSDKVRYPYDPGQAKSLLAEAGWTDSNGDGVLDKDGERLTLKGVLASWGELTAVATILQAQWKALGIQLDLEAMPYPAALEAGRNGTHHLVPFVFSGTDASLLRTFFHSSNIGAFNWSRVSDPQVDQWLDEGQTLSDNQARAARYLSVQEKIMSEAWILPIRDQVNVNAASSRVHDLEYDVQGWFPVLYDVWLSPGK
jgi:peptide/nickel transport system substrate-binding protein